MRVYVLGRSVLDERELERFLRDHGVEWRRDNAMSADSSGPGRICDSDVSAEVLCEVAGRVCYMSFARPRPGGNRAYLEHIKESGHGSVLEHAVWNLLITGVSRSLTHELVRHRVGFSYSQLSQRYVDESDAEFIEPDIIASDAELHALWVQAIEQAHAAYVRLSELLAEKLRQPEWTSRWLPEGASTTDRRKAARQAARSVLPNAIETKIFVTANARALRHFLEQRGSRYAEPEIRKLANRLLDLLQKESPNLFGDYQRVDLGDGTFEIVTEYRKV
jgi:thymidylate synthase (FAD)